MAKGTKSKNAEPAKDAKKDEKKEEKVEKEEPKLSPAQQLKQGNTAGWRCGFRGSQIENDESC